MGNIKCPSGRSNDFLTVGMEVLYDQAGSAGLVSNEVFPALNYHKSLSDTRTMYLSLGFMGGYAEKGLTGPKSPLMISMTEALTIHHFRTEKLLPSRMYSTGMEVWG